MNKLIEKFELKYNEKTNIIENSIANVGIKKALINNNVLRKHTFEFNNEIKLPKITDQEQTGRCWIFASLNVSRISIMEKLNVEEFEFSENFFLFYEKMEKANSFLQNIIDTAKDIDENTRLYDYLMKNPCDDGGYWHWFKSLIDKYGAVPKSIMPETSNSKNTIQVVVQLNERCRKYAQLLRKMVDEGKTIEDLNEIKEKALYECYDICRKSFGKIPDKFDFEYRDKDKKFCRISNLTPKKFYEEYVKDSVSEKIAISHDIRRKEYGRILEFKYLNAVYDKGNEWTINVPVEELKKATIKSIKNNIPVWFTCDVAKYSDYKLGIFDVDLYDYNGAFSDVSDFSKVDRLITGDTHMTHAMAFVGVNLDDNGKPINWKVENSWGEKYGNKGIFSMSDGWFTNYVFQVIVNKEFIDKLYLEAFNKEKIILEPWDVLA